MFERVNPPAGVAPPAGHVEDHGSPEAAAAAEVFEEVGLQVVSLTELATGWRDLRCGSRRLQALSGPSHVWTIYRAVVAGEVAANVAEARHPNWFTRGEVQVLADRTVGYARGLVSAAEFAALPGLEPVWVDWLARLSWVDVAEPDVAQVRLLTLG